MFKKAIRKHDIIDRKGWFFQAFQFMFRKIRIGHSLVLQNKFWKYINSW